MRKNLFLNISILFFGIMTFFCGLLWLNNIYTAILSYLNISTALTASISGFLPWMDWSTLDVSTISTMIPFFGVLFIFIGLLKIDFQPQTVKTDEFFPFFSAYDRVNMSLGLLGTVWGIILIGFYQSDKIGVATLMQCLHTALFSTLVAVAWVAIIIPTLIRPWMQFLLKNNIDRNNDYDKTITELIQSIQLSAADAGEELKNSAIRLHSFGASLESSEEKFKNLPERLSLLTNRFGENCQSMENAQKQHAALLSRSLTMVERMDQDYEHLFKSNLLFLDKLNANLENQEKNNLEERSRLSIRENELFQQCALLLTKINSAQETILHEIEELKAKQATPAEPQTAEDKNNKILYAATTSDNQTIKQ